MIPVESRAFAVSSHASNTLQVIADLRNQRILCDVTLLVGGQEYPAHRVILAGCSSYLRAMFTNGMLETECNKVTLHDLETSTMDALLEFMYCGQVTVSTDNVQALLHGASLFHLASLRSICTQFLQQHLDASNCIGIQSLADMYSCVDLESLARQYLYRHFLEVIRHEEFLNLSEDRLITLLQSNSLRVTREEQVFEALMMWIDWDPSRRSGSAYAVLKHVRLALIDDTYLENVVLRLQFIQSCAKCQALVADAIRTKNNRLCPDSDGQVVPLRCQRQGVFVLGGRNGVDCQLSSVEWYDSLHDHWINMAPLTTSRTAVGAAACGGLIYAVGGECALAESQEETAYLRSSESYDPDTNTWKQCADLAVPRSFIGVCAIGKCLYAIGGEDRMLAYNIVERYDTTRDVWTFLPNMKKQRSGAGVAVCNGKIYVAGGYDKNVHTDRASVECFDLDTHEWSFVGEMEKARSGLSLVAIDNYIYAIGGRSRYCDFYYSTVERFNTCTQQWSSLAAMNTPRAWPAVTALDNSIYVIGGFDSVNRLRSVEVYNVDQNTWTFISAMNVCRAGCAAVVL